METKRISREYLTVNEKGEIVWVEVRDERVISILDMCYKQGIIFTTNQVLYYPTATASI